MSKVSMMTFDIEIKKDPNTCSKKWKSHDEFGISVLAICRHDNFPEYEIKLFDEDTLGDGLEYLFSADVTSGFNTLYFDIPVIKATVKRILEGSAPGIIGKLDLQPHYDIYDAIKRAGVNIFQKGVYKLGAVAKNTIGRGKSGDGADAPRLFQEGLIKELHQYVTDDVTIEADLVRHVQKCGWIVDGNGNKLKIPRPADLVHIIKNANQKV